MANFDPSVLTDPSKISPLYSADSGQAGDRLTLLQQAMAYVKANPNTANADYLTKEIQADIQAEQGVTGYDQGQSNITDLSTRLAQSNKDLSRYGDPTNGYNLWLHESGTPATLGAYSKYSSFMDQTKKDIGDLTNGLSTANSDFTKSGANLVQNFRLPQPNIASALTSLQDYYHNPQTGQVALSTQPAINDIYQRNFNFKNNINAQAAAQGASQSGMRKKALDTSNSNAIQAATQVKDSAENQAAQGIQNFKTQTANETTQAKTLEDQIKNGGASNLFSGTTQNAITAFNDNASAQNQNAMLSSEQQLAQQQANDSFWNQTLGVGGRALGTFAGALI